VIAFDTDVLTKILLGNPVVVDRAATIPPHEQAVPIVVLEEIIRGRLQVIRQAEASRAKVTLSRAYDLFEQTLGDIRQVTVLSYTPQGDSLYRQWYHRRARVSTLYSRIAAICNAHEATLICGNRRDFLQVPWVRVEFWD
jgi:tRNA(fMet)-specific endonuclease VapC